MAGFSFSQFRGVAYRATSYDTPLWVFPNRRPGRWNNPDDGTIAQYCTLDAAAPLAEFLRHENVSDPAVEKVACQLLAGAPVVGHEVFPIDALGVRPVG